MPIRPSAPGEFFFSSQPFAKTSMLSASRRTAAKVPRSIRGLATSGLTRDSKVHQNLLEDFSYIQYKKHLENVNIVKQRLNRPLTYAEKLLYGHLDNPHEQEIERGVSYLKLRPDRVACQEIGRAHV